MARLKDWNEALVAHFLNRPNKGILFNVTQDVISEIHNSGGFDKSRDDSIEDFLMALCNEKTGYGKKIDDKFVCKTADKRKNGWPVKPENIFWNAYQLRSMFQDGNHQSVPTEKQYFKFPDFAPPWTSHLALAVLAASMNVGEQPGNARYPMIADLFGQKMNINNEDAKELNKHIQYEYVNKFFGKLSMYSGGYYWRAPRIVRYFSEEAEEWRSPWGTLYHWAEKQIKYPGSFRKVGGWITDPVTAHSRFRNDDRNAMLRALNSLSPGILPSNHALDQVINLNRSYFRPANTKSIGDQKLVAFREYAITLWENNQSEIRSYSPSNSSVSPPSPTSDLSGISEFQVMPYLYINLAEQDKTKRVKTFYPSLHHISGPLPEEREITIGEHKFQFYNTKRATSGIPLNSNGDLKLIHSEEIIENTESGYVSRIYSFKSSIDVYTTTGSTVVLTQDLHGMYEWSPEDEVSQGFRLVKGMATGWSDELLSNICDFKIGLQYDYERPKKSRVKEIGRTKIKLAGGSKISGGTDRRYHFENPPHFVLTRGFSSDVEFKKINPKEGEEGNYFLKDEPKQIQEKGKTIWKLSLKDDIFSDDFESSIVKLLYKLKTEEALTEVAFTVVKGVDHWQLHPVDEIDSNLECNSSTFDSSIFESLDLCKPISEEERAAKEAEAKAKAEKEAGEKKATEEAEAKAKAEREAAEQKAEEEANEIRREKRIKDVADANEKRRIRELEDGLRKTRALNPEPEPASTPQPEPDQEPESLRPVVKPELQIGNYNFSSRPGLGATKCVSCGVPLVDRKSTFFCCPNCDSSIGRCPRCRNNGVHYYCSGCNCVGP